MQLSLTDDEKGALIEILNQVLPNLREEVYKTESFDYREQLKRQEALIKGLLTRLCQPA